MLCVKNVVPHGEMLEVRNMALEIAPRITVDEKVRHGKPVIAGTRVPVHVLIAQMATGSSAEQVAEEYGVTAEDVYAALAYAASIISNEEVWVSA